MDNLNYLAIGFPSAMHYWLNGSFFSRTEAADVIRKSRIDLPEQYEIKNCKNLIAKISASGMLGSPLCIYTSNKNERIRTESCISYLCPKNIPNNSFCLLNAGEEFAKECRLAVAGPELCFLEAGKTYPFAELVFLANCLCGAYVADKNAQYGIRKRTPITFRELLMDYLNDAGGAQGVRQCRHAVQYAVDNSFSPMESLLGVVCRLRIADGGFAVKPGLMNGINRLSPEGAKILGAEQCRCDMSWPEDKVAIEYDSNMTHLTPQQHEMDKRRANALKASGYTVFTITAADINNVDRLDELFMLVRKELGMRKETGKFERYRTVRENVIRRLIAVKNDLYGRL